MKFKLRTRLGVEVKAHRGTVFRTVGFKGGSIFIFDRRRMSRSGRGNVGFSSPAIYSRQHRRVRRFRAQPARRKCHFKEQNAFRAEAIKRLVLTPMQQRYSREQNKRRWGVFQSHTQRRARRAKNRNVSDGIETRKHGAYHRDWFRGEGGVDHRQPGCDSVSASAGRAQVVTQCPSSEALSEVRNESRVKERRSSMGHAMVRSKSPLECGFGLAVRWVWQRLRRVVLLRRGWSWLPTDEPGRETSVRSTPSSDGL